MIVRLTRFVSFTVGALGGFAVSGLIDWSEEIGFPETSVIILFIILGCAIGYLFGGIVGRGLSRWYNRLEEQLRSVASTDLILAIVGITTGLLISLLAAYPLRIIEPKWLSFLSIVLMMGLAAYGGMRVFLVRREDFARLVGRRIETELVEEPAANVKILDTSAVIDGRFPELVRRSLVEGRTVVPAFVVSELQTLADSADDLKRAKGRRGLDLLEAMKGAGLVDLFSVDYTDTPDVDSKLLRFVHDIGGTLVTVDFNLTKVARVQDVTVVNLNEIADALRLNVMAGEPMRITIVREGKEPGQGVGYLEDGTMVVVEGASGLMGQEIDTVVSSIFQASAGRMVFARLEKDR